MIVQSIIMSFKSVLSNKLRSFLTMLGIIIGVISVVVLVSIGQGTTSSVTSSIEAMGTNLLSVNIMGYRNSSISVSMEDLYELEGKEGLSRVAPVMNQSVTAKAGLNTFDASVAATVPGYDTIRDIKLSTGRFLTQPDIDNRTAIAVIGTEVADELFGHRMVIGEEIVVSNQKFKVVGLMEEKGTDSMNSNDSTIIIPYTLAERMYNQKGISTLYASADSPDNVSLAQTTLENFLLTKFNNDSDSYKIQNQSDMLDTLNESTAMLTLMLGGIAGISLLVGGIGIMNIMLVSVTERTREIGIRKAIGAGRGAILLQFLIEALVISLLGGVIGLILSIGILILLQGFFELAFTLSASVIELAIAFSVLIGVIFGLYPANRASKLRPIDALRYE